LHLPEDVAVKLGAVYAVADGVSGQVGGEVASKIAIDTLRMYYVLPHVEIPTVDRIRNVFLEAHRRIAEYAMDHPEYRGMGTTMTTAVLQENTVYYGHVGDSRLYVIQPSQGKITQQTEDHTLVRRFVLEGKLTPEEAAQENSHVLEQALGCVSRLRIDTGSAPTLTPGDLVLITSDGLTDLVSDAKIRDIVLGAPSLEEASARLVKQANQRGGRDNITVVLVSLEENT
jgi:PPM family protein phosphatase